VWSEPPPDFEVTTKNSLSLPTSAPAHLRIPKSGKRAITFGFPGRESTLDGDRSTPRVASTRRQAAAVSHEPNITPDPLHPTVEQQACTHGSGPKWRSLHRIETHQTRFIQPPSYDECSLRGPLRKANADAAESIQDSLSPAFRFQSSSSEKRTSAMPVHITTAGNCIRFRRRDIDLASNRDVQNVKSSKRRLRSEGITTHFSKLISRE